MLLMDAAVSAAIRLGYKIKTPSGPAFVSKGLTKEQVVEIYGESWGEAFQYYLLILKKQVHDNTARDILTDAIFDCYENFDSRKECSPKTYLRYYILYYKTQFYRNRQTKMRGWGAKEITFLSLDESFCKDDETYNLYDCISDRLETNPAERFWTKSQSSEIQELLLELTEKERTVLNLIYCDGLILKDVGKVIGTTPQQVANIRNTAKKKLLKLLKEREMKYLKIV